MNKTVYTVGTGTRTIEQFLYLLKTNGIRNLIDVRRFPTSRFNHFCQENLKEHLALAEIDYYYLGSELGGYREGGYKNYILLSEYQQGIERLVQICRSAPSAIMCAETLPWRCHRRFISLTLKQQNWQVIHLIDIGKVIKF